MKTKYSFIKWILVLSMLYACTLSGYGAETPTPIYSWSDLNNVRLNMSGTYLLMNDLNEKSAGYSTYVGNGWNPIGDFIGTQWDPDSSQSVAFTGSFDGQGYTISGLVSQRSSDDGVGLFAYINRGTVKNLKLININVSGRRHVGGLAGFLAYANISDCSAAGNVKAENNVGGLLGTVRPLCNVVNCSSSAVVDGQVIVKSSLRCGGLIGAAYNSEISGCSTSGKVTGNFFDTGGLIGSIYDGTRISNCFSTGDVYGTGAVAGLVGSTNQASVITNCYSTGAVTATYQEVGGLIGNINYGTVVINCYATGNVQGGGEWVGGLIGIVCNNSSVRSSYALGNVTNSSSLTGGLVGHLSSGATIYDSYARGNVSASGGVGGLVGLMDNGLVSGCYSTGRSTGNYAVGGLIGARSNSTVTNSYWDTISSGLSTSSGGTGLTTLQMVRSSSYLGWNFIDLWKIVTDASYPYFAWQGSVNIPYVSGITPNQSPLAANDSFTILQDSGANVLAVLANDSDPDGDEISIMAVTQGINGSVSYNNSDVVYTPMINFYGMDSFSYSISDGKGGMASAVVTVNVIKETVNNAPVANPDQATVYKNSSGNLIDVLANDTDLDGDTLSLNSITQPSNGNAVIIGGKVSYSPVNAYSGTDSFSYTISDGKGGTSVGTVSILVFDNSVFLDISMTTVARNAGKNLFVKAKANLQTGIQNATVQGVWSDAVTGTVSGLTDASGKVSFDSSEIKYKNSQIKFIFTVQKVTVDGVDFNLLGEFQDSVTFTK